jgi:hypothetical protein
LVNADVTSAGVIAAYHERRVLPLVRQERRLFDMVPGASLEGTVLVAAPLDRAEVKKRVKSALGIMITDAELDIHPPMRLDHNAVDLVRYFFFAISYSPSISAICLTVQSHTLLGCCRDGTRRIL